MGGAVLAQPNPSVVIKGHKYEAVPHPKKNWSAMDHLIDFTKSANGAFRSFKLLESITRVVATTLKDMGSAMAAFFEKLAGKLSLAWTMLAIPRLPEVTRSAWRAIRNWSVPQKGPATTDTRDKVQKIHDIADATATWGYASSLVLSSSTLKTMADIPDLITNVTDLAMAAEDRGLALDHLKSAQAQGAKPAVQQMFKDSIQESFWRMLKAACSIASSILGLFVLAFGGPVLPAIALIALGLTGTVAALTANFFKDTRPHVLPEFHKIRNPEVLVTAAPAG